MRRREGGEVKSKRYFYLERPHGSMRASFSASRSRSHHARGLQCHSEAHSLPVPNSSGSSLEYLPVSCPLHLDVSLPFKLSVSKMELQKRLGSLTPKPASPSPSMALCSLVLELENISAIPDAFLPLAPESHPSVSPVVSTLGNTSPLTTCSATFLGQATPTSHLGDSPHCLPTSTLVPNSSHSELLGPQI